MFIVKFQVLKDSYIDLQFVGDIFRFYMLLFSYFGPQAALAKANFAKKRNVKLDTSLREKLLQSCQLLRPHPKGKDKDKDKDDKVKPFYPKPCHHFGICVCTKYPDSKWMFNNISRHFRIIFANKKKQPTLARTIMDKFGIVLRFSPDLPKSNKAETCLDEWDITYEEETNAGRLSAVEDTGNLHDMFFHIGFMNYKTFHFCCQQLEMESLEQHSQSVSKDLLWLTPAGAESGDDKRLEVYTDMELFAYLLDSKVPWTVTVFKFTNAAGLGLLSDSSLPVVPLVEPFKVWHGSVEEASRRRLQQESEKAAKAAKERNRERKPKRKHEHTARCSSKTKRQRQALQSVEVDATESAFNDDLLDIFDDLQQDCDKNKDETNEVASEHDDIGNVYDDGAVSEDDDDDDDADKNIDNEIGGEEDRRSEAPASVKSALTEDDVDDLNLNLEEDLGDASAVSRAPDEEHAPQTLELPPEGPPVRRPREPGGTRSSENRILASLLMSHSLFQFILHFDVPIKTSNHI